MKLSVEKSGRVDKLLADALPQYSRAALAKLFNLGHIKIDGKQVRAGHKVLKNAVIEADISPLQQNQQVIELPVIYEDDDILVVNKPEGIISHARGRYWYEPSVASFVRWKLTGGNTLKGTVVPNEKHIPDYLVTKSYPLKADTDGVDRIGIVHRLDRATSGVMICAKNDKAMKSLQKQFAERSVQKTYIAVLDGVPKQPEALIDAPIQRNPKKPSTFKVGANGKQSQTQYKVLKTKGKQTLIEFQPKTGRTHQLRVHALYIGSPIVGDVLYNPHTTGDRLLLHAHTITIELPSTKEQVTFTAPLPKEFSL